MKLSQINEGSVPVKWRKAQFAEELAEFRRVSDDSGISLRDLRDAYKRASLQRLGDSDWSRLENTDSYDIRSMIELETLAKIYGRDYHPIMRAIDRGIEIPAAIILNHDGKLTLVAGNTRLMCCRIKRIIPEVIILTV